MVTGGSLLRLQGPVTSSVLKPHKYSTRLIPCLFKLCFNIYLSIYACDFQVDFSFTFPPLGLFIYCSLLLQFIYFLFSFYPLFSFIYLTFVFCFLLFLVSLVCPLVSYFLFESAFVWCSFRYFPVSSCTGMFRKMAVLRVKLAVKSDWKILIVQIDESTGY